MVLCFGYSNLVCIVNHCAANICASLSILQVSNQNKFNFPMFIEEKTMFLFIQKLCVFIFIHIFAAWKQKSNGTRVGGANASIRLMASRLGMCGSGRLRAKMLLTERQSHLTPTSYTYQQCYGRKHEILDGKSRGV